LSVFDVGDVVVIDVARVDQECRIERARAPDIEDLVAPGGGQEGGQVQRNLHRLVGG
jgi:hypothetical protein